MNPRSSADSFGYEIPQYTSQPPQIFGALDADGNPLPPTMPTGNFFVDDNDLNGDDNDPKRRRIARVSHHVLYNIPLRLTFRRLVICAGKRKSSATGNCQNVVIASTTRQNAFLRRWRKSGIRRKGRLHGLDEECLIDLY